MELLGGQFYGLRSALRLGVGVVGEQVCRTTSLAREAYIHQRTYSTLVFGPALFLLWEALSGG